MHAGRFIFSQLMDFVPKYEFDKCVRRYGGNCTLADANENRDWRIYAEFAQVLIAEARTLYADEDFGVELDNTVYALDASTIDLCLSLFPWAKFRKAKGAVKLHALLNLRGSIPEFIHISDGKLHDVNVLDIMIPEAGSIYVMDRGYVDFKRLHALHQASAFFVTRAKRNLRCDRRYSRPVDKSTGLRCDQTVVLAGVNSKKAYPETMRRVVYRDAETGKRFVFLSNHFEHPFAQSEQQAATRLFWPGDFGQRRKRIRTGEAWSPIRKMVPPA